jgi:glutamyl-tRNA reductase
MDHDESLRHLLGVAAGLESVVLGEDQVLGQVRGARDDAAAAGGLGAVLSDVVAKALHVGERARNETAINEGVVSMGSAAVRLARRERTVTGNPALVVGAGEMGQLAAKALAHAGASHVTVANRTIERARRVAAELDCDASATTLSDVEAALADAAVAVTATSSETALIDATALGAAGDLVVVDLGQPRDVAPVADDVPAVTIYDVGDILPDDHYQARGAFVEVDDADLGPVKTSATFPRFSRTPGSVDGLGPRHGEHNRDVYVGEVGLDEETFADLRDSGVI